MRGTTILSTLLAGVFTICAGCETSDNGGSRKQKTISYAGEGQKPSPKQPAEQPAVRVAMTAENNPTRRGGRGEPSLDDFQRAAAWIYIDGQEGKFIERDRQPQAQWMIETPGGSSPTFRVEAYEPLLGTPRDFNCTLDSVDAPDDSSIAYAIQAGEGTFEVGHEYSLLRPGDNFVIRNRATGDVVAEIAPLPPGTYMLAAGIKNREMGVEGLAITYFTVGNGAGK